MSKKQTSSAPEQELQATLDQLQDQLHQAKEQVLRSQADYQNLVRRTRDERAKSVQMAAREVVERFLDPFDHLRRAAQQIDDQGLQMVVEEFRQAMQQVGLEEINPEGQPFDVETMEAVDSAGDGETVTAVQSVGYRLNGMVIRHAKVVVG